MSSDSCEVKEHKLGSSHFRASSSKLCLAQRSHAHTHPIPRGHTHMSHQERHRQKEGQKNSGCHVAGTGTVRDAVHRKKTGGETWTERQGELSRRKTRELRWIWERNRGLREKRSVPALSSSGVECADRSWPQHPGPPGSDTPFSFNQVCFKP